MIIQHIVMGSQPTDPCTRRYGANIRPQTLDSLAVSLAAAWDKIQGEEQLTRQGMSVDVHLRDHKAEEVEDDSDSHEDGEFLQTFE
jgi:hypothetical protein